MSEYKQFSILFAASFRHFTYVTAHSPTLPSLHLRHSSFSNPFVASLTSQLILQPFFRFSYVTGSSLTSPGEPPMLSTARAIQILGSQPTFIKPILILSSHLCPVIPNDLFLQVSPLKLCMHFRIAPYVLHVLFISVVSI